MREIKFRTWDRDRGVMRQLDALYFGLLEREENIASVVTIEPENIPRYSSCQANLKGRYEVMQYTGLKDKNGTEIYEGDLVWHLKYCGNYSVVYSCENTGYDLKADKDSMHLSSACCPNLEVIGNIYEQS